VKAEDVAAEKRRERSRVAILTEVSRLLTSPNGRFEPAFQAFQAASNSLSCGGVVAGQLDRAVVNETPTDRCSRLEELQERLGDGCFGVPGLEVPSQCLHHAGDVPVHRGEEKCVFASERLVEAALAERHSAQEIIEGGGFVAARPKELEAAIEGRVGIELLASRHRSSP
jgi:hypothetical protein